MRDRIDESALLVALGLAQRAPSIHNSQPWLWRAAGDSLHLFADRDRQLADDDPTGRDLVISCGAALHHLRVALGSAGWTGEVRRFPNPADQDHLATVELRRRDRAGRDIATTMAINQRRTDRRDYSSWPVPDGMISRLIDEAANEGVVLRRTVNSARGRLIAAIREAGRTHCEPSSSDTRNGDASVLMIAGTPDDDAMSWLRAGEATSAILLAATEYRLANAPLTQALNVADTRERLRDEVLHGGLFPQLIVRVGFAPLSAPPVPRTSRRSANDAYRRVD